MNGVSPRSTIPPPRPPLPQIYKRQSLDLSNHLPKYIEDKKRNSVVNDFTALESRLSNGENRHEWHETENSLDTELPQSANFNEVPVERDLPKKVGDERPAPRNDFLHHHSNVDEFQNSSPVDNNNKEGKRRNEENGLQKPRPLPRQHCAPKPVASQRSLHSTLKTKSIDEDKDGESAERKQKPVAPPRQQYSTEPKDICSDTAAIVVECPKGATSSNENCENSTQQQQNEEENNAVVVPPKNVSNLDSIVQESTSSSISRFDHQKRPSIELTETVRLRSNSDKPTPLDPLRLAPERSSVRKLRSVLTPPLPRPLIPAPPPPPRVRPVDTSILSQDNSSGKEMSVGNLFFDDPRRTSGQPPLPSHPPPSSQSVFLNLNTLPLRFVDDNDTEHRERRRRQLLQGTLSFPLDLQSDIDNDFIAIPSDFDDEDDDESFIRLSVLQTNNLNGQDYDSNLNESSEANEETNDGERFCFSGWVVLIVSTKKQRKCWLRLSGSELSFFEDDTQDTPFIGPLDLDRILFLGLFTNTIHTVFKNRVGSEKGIVEYKFVPDENQSFWLEMLTKASCQNTKVLRSNIQSSSAGGRLWLKQTLSDEWSEGWAFVTDRRLRYWVPSLEALFELDLRKTVQIKKDLNREYWCQRVQQRSEHGPLLITLDGSCLYMQSESDVCTLLWHDFFTQLFRSAQRIDEYCLTADGVPLLVDKCIRFIQTHGMDLKGIYRKNGSAAEARSLMKDFTDDPFNFHIMRINDESSNVAADVLRAFFRQLLEPLIPIEFHKTFYHIAELSDPDSRIEAYRATLAQFSIVNFNTIRRLMSHLNEVAEHSDKNMASIDNLAKVFGPTVFGFDKTQSANSAALASIRDIPGQIKVVKDLLTYFKDIFPLSSREMVAKEKIEEIQSKKIIPKARANGFLVPIHLFQNNNQSFNVQSHWQACQVIDFKREQLEASGQKGEDYALFEVHAQGRLERRVASDEVLSHMVLDRWLEWRTAFTDPYLVLKKDLEKIDAMKTNAFADDVKYAESGSKSFKAVHFKLESGTRVVCYSKAMKPLGKWNLAQTLWFMGSTEKRNPPNPFTLTFFVVQGNEKTKIKNQLSGTCISFHDNEQRTQWLNCIIICKRECQEIVICNR